MARRNLEKFAPQNKNRADRPLLALTFLLTIVGILFIADVSAPQASKFFSDSLFFVKQQLVWGVLGVVALIVASNIHYSFWKKTAFTLFGISLAMLVLVLIPGFGNRLLGARRWLGFGPFTVQPAEIVKLTLIIYLSRLAELKRPETVYIVPIALVAALVMFEPDLGTTIIIVIIGLFEIFLAGIPLIHLALAAGGGGLLAFLTILFSSYRRDRLINFISSLKDPLDTSYHVKQILYALGSGGLFGVGIGLSKQKYLFLPEAATDSVFAIIAEEIGFLGALLVIALMLIFIIRILRIAKHAPDTFSMMLASGIAVWIGGQMFLNLGSMVALVPLTGVPLPFFSYGGSSLTMLLFGVGILLNISKFANIKEKS